jgi:hypothetical protein
MKWILSLWMLTSASVIADDWGLLFFSPAERLNQARQTAAPVASAVASNPAQPRFYNGRIETPRHQWHWIDGQIAPAPRQHKPGEMLNAPTD